jgi:Tfp pilus assembly protein PilO
MTDTPQTFFQAHERLIITVLVIVAVVFIGHSWIDHYYEVAKVAVTTTATTLTTQQDENKKLEQSLEDFKQQFAQTVSALQTQNTQLASQAATAMQQAANQQAIDSKLNNSQLAQKLDQLTNQQGIQSNPQGVNLNHDQSVTVTQTLEDVPALQEQVKNLQQININNTQQITGLNTEVSQCTDANKGLQTQITDQKKADDAELKKAKISGFKSKLKWFGAGVVAGFTLGHIY